MNITYPWRHTTFTTTIPNYIESSLNGSDYDGGQLEKAQRTARNATEALGRLVELLAERRMLNAADIARVAGDSAEGVILNRETD